MIWEIAKRSAENRRPNDPEAAKDTTVREVDGFVVGMADGQRHETDVDVSKDGRVFSFERLEPVVEVDACSCTPVDLDDAAPLELHPNRFANEEPFWARRLNSECSDELDNSFC